MSLIGEVRDAPPLTPPQSKKNEEVGRRDIFHSSEPARERHPIDLCYGVVVNEFLRPLLRRLDERLSPKRVFILITLANGREEAMSKRWYCVVEILTGRELYLGQSAWRAAEALDPGTVHRSGNSSDEAGVFARDDAKCWRERGYPRDDIMYRRAPEPLRSRFLLGVEDFYRATDADSWWI